LLAGIPHGGRGKRLLGRGHEAFLFSWKKNPPVFFFPPRREREGSFSQKRTVKSLESEGSYASLLGGEGNSNQFGDFDHRRRSVKGERPSCNGRVYRFEGGDLFCKGEGTVERRGRRFLGRGGLLSLLGTREAGHGEGEGSFVQGWGKTILSGSPVFRGMGQRGRV